MVLLTHQLQDSHIAFPSRPLSRWKGLTLKRHVVTVHMLGRRERGISRHSVCSSIGAPHTCGSKVKNVGISTFKGSGQNNESRGRTNNAFLSKNTIKVSYVPKDREETMIESSNVHNVPLAYASETSENHLGSPAIQKLFKKWIMILLSQSPHQVMDEVTGVGPPPRDTSETQIGTQSNGKSEILKMVWSHFWDMDVTIKLPILLFIPLYMAVSLIYGAEVSKELTPLWVFGPLIVALYIRILRGLCALYILCLKQTLQIVGNLPTYYVVAYNYIAHGKLKEEVRARVWQPVVNIKNLDYKELSRRKMKDFQEWMMETYVDIVESVWPYYCRTIRFLKRANII
ncbi:hypothetical protein E1A91_D07G073400v1 [Gossypium mustelinum]|uniref:Uncharacterized protein n=1 Tax=Gossypium mustelinum TaxID=34275 RepID=A0A5D2U5A1_GOSMU|nr:hypothetical protein E1A91_D07G073400v1 [Gossypium mustelinum]TYI72620.1 hypothetical protein E1A91_D07G073400v1 [Gossypium mustelinum]